MSKDLSNGQYLNTSTGLRSNMNESRSRSGLFIGLAALAVVLFLSGYWMGGRSLSTTGNSVQQLEPSSGIIAREGGATVSGSSLLGASVVNSSSASSTGSSAGLSSQIGSASVSSGSSVFSPSSAQAALIPILLRQVLDLRIAAAKNDTVKTSLLVTKIQDLVAAQKSSVLGERWDAVALCLARECANAEFLRFVTAVATEADRLGSASGSLILNLLAVNQYWQTDNTVRFSEAVTSVDRSVSQSNQTQLSSSWNAIVDCAGKCPNKESLLFSFFDALA